MIAAVVNVPAYYLMALPEIQSVQDLRGKKVGITRIGASSDFAIRLVLRKAGLVPDKDVALIQVGESSSLAAALSTRAIAAAAALCPCGFSVLPARAQCTGLAGQGAADLQWVWRESPRWFAKLEGRRHARCVPCRPG